MDFTMTAGKIVHKDSYVDVIGRCVSLYILESPYVYVAHHIYYYESQITFCKYLHVHTFFTIYRSFSFV